MMMTKYRKKPVVIDAFKFDGTVNCLRKNVDKKDWGKFIFVSLDPTDMFCQTTLNGDFSFQVQDYATRFFIGTSEGQYNLSEGDYVVKDVEGKYYPVKPDIFKKTYEKATDVQPVLLTKIERDYMVAVLDGFLKGKINDNNSIVKNEEINFGLKLSKKLENTKKE